jgi:hypothetical protein
MSLVPPGRAGRREPASSVAPIWHRIWALPASLARTAHRTLATKHIMLEPLGTNAAALEGQSGFLPVALAADVVADVSVTELDQPIAHDHGAVAG